MLRTGSRKFNYLLSKNLSSVEISAELLSMCKTFLQKVYIDYFRSNAIMFSGDFMENIKLSGAKNVRDFGSIVNKDGRKIKPHCFIRGNALCDLSDKDAKKYYFLVLLMTKSKEKASGLKGVFRAEEEYLDSAFSAINESYGSVDSFIKDRLGISDDIKQQLQSKYLL